MILYGFGYLCSYFDAGLVNVCYGKGWWQGRSCRCNMDNPCAIEVVLEKRTISKTQAYHPNSECSLNWNPMESFSRLTPIPVFSWFKSCTDHYSMGTTIFFSEAWQLQVLRCPNTLLDVNLGMAFLSFKIPMKVLGWFEIWIAIPVLKSITPPCKSKKN